MKISENGIAIIKKWEGCCLKAKKCVAGVWTIGYGHTGKYNGKAITESTTITQAQADKLLESDLVAFEKKVNKYSKYGFNQNQFDALVSFAFNIGSIDQLTKNGTRTITQIAEKITAYCNVNGTPVKGLVNRRKAEKELFSKPVEMEYYPIYTGTSASIIEILKAIGATTDCKNDPTKWYNRKEIANCNCISNYTGSATQNMKLIALAKSGKLRKVGY